MEITEDQPAIFFVGSDGELGWKLSGLDSTDGRRIQNFRNSVNSEIFKPAADQGLIPDIGFLDETAALQQAAPKRFAAGPMASV